MIASPVPALVVAGTSLFADNIAVALLVFDEGILQATKFSKLISKMLLIIVREWVILFSKIK